MNKKLIFGILVVLFAACSETYEYWDISKFKISNDALTENEEIKLLYSTRSAGANKDLEYYIHLVVVSEKTGDTVNVLTIADNGFSAQDRDKIFNFFTANSVMTKIMQTGTENLDGTNVKDLEKIELKKIDKVLRDPKFDPIADNNFPTVIGTIGTMTKNGE